MLADRAALQLAGRARAFGCAMIAIANCVSSIELAIYVDQ